MPDWSVKITTPNGHNGHMVVNSSSTDQEIAEAITGFVQQMRGADVEPIAGTPGMAAAVQPSRKP